MFPELFAVGLPPEGVGMYAQSIPGPVTDAFAKLAHDTGSHIVFGMPEKGESAIYNTLVLAGPAGIVGRYHKTHLFYDAHRPHRNEQQLFEPGRHLGNFDTAVGALGLFTCHDGLYPEVPRCLTLSGRRSAGVVPERRPSLAVGAASCLLQLDPPRRRQSS